MEYPELKSQSIRIQKVLPGPRWKVFRLITRIEDFPRHMPNVRKSQFIKKTKGGALTEWFVEIDGLPIKWKQKDSFDYPNFTIRFRRVAGDLEKLEGSWVLRPAKDGGTEVTVEVNVRLGIPILENVVNDILQLKLRKNFEMMLAGMEEILLNQKYQRIETGHIKTKEKLKGFVVMGHPYNFQHLLKIFRVFKPEVVSMTPEFLLKVFEMAPSYHSSDIKNFRSETGQVVDGYFVMCPIIPDMVNLNPELVFLKVLEGCRIGERFGAGILALGGFTSIVGEKYFQKLKSQVKIPVTTGNAFTSAMALAGVRKACRLMEIPLKDAKAVIIGGTGDIGSACARVLAREVKELIVTGRTPASVRNIEKKLKEEKGARITTTMDNNAAVKKADIVIAAASSSRSVVDMNMIKPGAVVCDVAYPKNISENSSRQDIFVFSGGLSTVPTPFNLGFDVGLPSPHILYGCFAESIILSLEGRYENFSEGKGHISPEKIAEIQAMGEKHGFRPAPFYWGNKLLNEENIESILHTKTR